MDDLAFMKNVTIWPTYDAERNYQVLPIKKPDPDPSNFPICSTLVYHAGKFHFVARPLRPGVSNARLSNHDPGSLGG